LFLLMATLFMPGTCQSQNPPQKPYYYQELASNAMVWAISDGGFGSVQAVGYLEKPTTHAALFGCGRQQTDPIAICPLDVCSVALEINSPGQVVGVLFNGSCCSHGSDCSSFLWTRNQGMQDLGTFRYDWSQANVMNDFGQIAGMVGTSDNQSFEAFLWSKMQGVKFLGTLGGSSSYPYGINNIGQVVGGAMTKEGTYHAFLWGEMTGMQDLGIPGNESEANAINDQGQVVGDYLDSGGYQHAFLWTKKTGMKDLGNLGGIYVNSLPTGINKFCQVVGTAYADWTTNHAFLWTPTRGMKDLNDRKLVVNLPEGVTLAMATDINNSGQIVGLATVDGVNISFLLTPVPGAYGW
jgi:probable HAF family extracellular repeat protein